MLVGVAGHRYVYVAGVVLAGWVAGVGLFAPGRIDLAVPWHLPPLHARVIGALYLSGAVFMAAMALGRRWSRQAVVAPMIAIWTGGLFVVLLLHWERVTRVDVTAVIWLVSYALLPVSEALRVWRHRNDPAPAAGPPPPRRLRAFLVAQGVVLTGTAVALLLQPTRLAEAWPWPAEPFVLHVYAAPLAAFGIGSLLAARRALDDLAIMLPASAVFAGAALTVSVLHRDLFHPGLATWVWFGGFTLAFVGLAGGSLLRYTRGTS